MIIREEEEEKEIKGQHVLLQISCTTDKEWWDKFLWNVGHGLNYYFSLRKK